MDNVKVFVVEYLEREYDLPEDIDFSTFNYIESGYVDSMGFIQFVTMLEDEYDIEFTDEELSDKTYQIIGNFIRLIESKIESRA